MGLTCPKTKLAQLKTILKILKNEKVKKISKRVKQA